ncbi:hypothetical protein EI94DRAFT_1802757 [Lactarius quietus]|nr:hypothetical protein EI94DRAFT_1802757 [Lactarius quietus]
MIHWVLKNLQPNTQKRPHPGHTPYSTFAKFSGTTSSNVRYANKPSAIDAVAAAKCGWVKDGKDRLMNHDAGTSRSNCLEAQGRFKHLVPLRSEQAFSWRSNAAYSGTAEWIDMHKDGCPWIKRQCNADVYRIPLSSPAAMAKEIMTRARSSESMLEDIVIKHPLVRAIRPA